MLKRERIIEILAYDPLSGSFVWRAHTSLAAKYSIGAPAGTVTKKGYRTIMIDGCRILAHRLAWVISYGRWPVKSIDHVNGVKGDNRLINLREATNSQNKANGKKYKNNQSGFKGVYYEHHVYRKKKWRASIRKNGRLINLGYFVTRKEAHLAYCQAALLYHGEFARST